MMATTVATVSATTIKLEPHAGGELAIGVQNVKRAVTALVARTCRARTLENRGREMKHQKGGMHNGMTTDDGREDKGEVLMHDRTVELIVPPLQLEHSERRHDYICRE